MHACNKNFIQLVAVQEEKMNSPTLFRIICSLIFLWGKCTGQTQEDPAVTRFREYLRIDTAHPNPNYSK